MYVGTGRGRKCNCQLKLRLICPISASSNRNRFRVYIAVLGEFGKSRAFASHLERRGKDYWRHLSDFSTVWPKQPVQNCRNVSGIVLNLQTFLPAGFFLKKITIWRTKTLVDVTSICATRTTRRLIWVIYQWSTLVFLWCLITNIGTFCFSHLNHFARKSFTSIRTMSAQKRPLTALSTAKTAAAVKMIIVPSNNQTFRVGSTIRVITPTSGQAPGQAIKLENEERKLDVNMQAVEKELSGIVI